MSKFIVVAGKYDGQEENTKFIHPAETLEEAVALLDTVSDYPWSKIEMVTGEYPNQRNFELVEVTTDVNARLAEERTLARQEFERDELDEAETLRQECEVSNLAD